MRREESVNAVTCERPEFPLGADICKLFYKLCQSFIFPFLHVLCEEALPVFQFCCVNLLEVRFFCFSSTLNNIHGLHLCCRCDAENLTGQLALCKDFEIRICRIEALSVLAQQLHAVWDNLQLSQFWPHIGYNKQGL